MSLLLNTETFLFLLLFTMCVWDTRVKMKLNCKFCRFQFKFSLKYMPKKGLVLMLILDIFYEKIQRRTYRALIGGCVYSYIFVLCPGLLGLISKEK